MGTAARAALAVAALLAAAALVVAAVAVGGPHSPPVGGLGRPWTSLSPPPPSSPSPLSPPSPPVDGTAAPRHTPPATVPSPSVDCSRTACVALTFDDGPSPYTATLLDILDRRHAEATFFVTGQHALALPALVRRAFEEGYAIGDHTVSHPRLTRLPAARVRDQIGTAARDIARATGTTPDLMRPPFGARNTTVLAAAGMPVILWNVSPRDWKVHNAAVIERRVLAAARPGAIVLLHDTYPATVAAVPSIVDGLRARGYTLVTIPRLFSGTRLRPDVAYSAGPAPRPAQEP